MWFCHVSIHLQEKGESSPRCNSMSFYHSFGKEASGKVRVIWHKADKVIFLRHEQGHCPHLKIILYVIMDMMSTRVLCPGFRGHLSYLFHWNGKSGQHITFKFLCKGPGEMNFKAVPNKTLNECISCLTVTTNNFEGSTTPEQRCG